MTIIKGIVVSFDEFSSGPRDTMPEDVGYITELIANSCYKAVCYTVLGPTGVNLCMVHYLTWRGMCSCIVVKEFTTPESFQCASW